MVLFCVAIRRDSVSLLRFPFLSHIQVFSCEMLLISHLKRPYSYFSSHFCFLVIVILLVFMLSVLFGDCNQSSSALFYVVFKLSYQCVNAVVNAGSPLPPSFLDTYSLSTSSMGYNALCMVISFLDLWSIFLSSLIHFRYGLKYLTKGTGFCFIVLSWIAFWFSWDTLS